MTGRVTRWLPLALGIAVVIGVVVVALRFTEGHELMRVARRAQPGWMVLALVLQLATYFAQGEIWCAVARAARYPLTRRLSFELSLAKLFIDQALPSLGVSGTVVVASALQRRGMPRPAVMAGVVVNTASYHGAYVLCLAVAVSISVLARETNQVIELVCGLFALLSTSLVVAVLVLAGRRHLLEGRWARLRPVRRAAGLLIDADPTLARTPRVLLVSGLYQASIFALDAATMWALLEALGADAPPSGVFASFVISSVFRSVGLLPGGLGTFEASSLVTLRLVGVDLAPALAATLLFRGLSFWLPMLPGLWFSRRAVRSGGSAPSKVALTAPWSTEHAELFSRLATRAEGLTSSEAAARLVETGPNELERARRLGWLRVLWAQLRSPLQLLLVFAAAVSALTGEWSDAAIVLVIVVVTVGFGFQRELRAESAIAALRARVKTRSTVLRDGRPGSVPVSELVPGDVVLLAAGSLIPADAVVLEAQDCHVSEAALTGESFPVEKSAALTAPGIPLSGRTNGVFMGTNVRSGTARCLVVATGRATQFGQIAQRLRVRPPETEFDRGIRQFGYLLTSAMLVLVLAVFAAHVLAGRPPIETLLFSIALAVGLSPELLPAVLSVNLGRGAELMAQHGVLVRRLSAIENLGSMNVLCTDKTGTLTEGVVQAEGGFDARGEQSERALELAAINAALQTGLPSPLDDALLAARTPDLSGLRKRAEIPFDFTRKRVSVIVDRGSDTELVTKGAFLHVLPVCTRLADGTPLEAEQRAALEARHDAWSREGLRVLAVASGRLASKGVFSRADEEQLTFEGFVTFLDRPRHGVKEAIGALARLGVGVKMITGDSRLVARHVAGLVGLAAERVLTGDELDALHDEALWHAAERTELFVEVDPNQKERIILALKKMGHVVGFLGDGVNDAPAMHAADTSLSVDQAVDVAREAADFVLLKRDLEVIRRGIEEGRRTFANTLKYLLTTTSANLGNMLSMAAASLYLPFLPLLAGQILLNNFLSDIPAVGIAGDAVDPELIEQPRRWDLRFIARFMLEFGALSSAFDLLTFALLLGVFAAPPELFRTGWFVESLLTELVIALVVRTRRPFFRSRPGTVLTVTTLLLIPLTFALPFLPHASVLGFVPLPPTVLLALAGITAAYVLAAELLKQWFYRRGEAHAR